MPRMGRLFWKFFLFFALAQLLTSLGVGLAMWSLHPAGMPAHPMAAPHPPDFSVGPMAPPPETRFGQRPLPPPGAFERGNILLSPPVMPLLAGSIVSLIFAAALAWYFARPIRTLRNAFDDLANGQLDVRLREAMAGRKDELADLGQAFDRMADRLQGLVDGQRRLLHDVSHELRSPLARLQAATDLLAQQPDRAVEFVGRIDRETARIDQLVGELLTLARLDAGMTPSLKEPVDVAELLGAIADDAAFEARASSRSVVLDAPQGVTIPGSREFLHRAIENVVRNALRYSPEGGEVLISALPDASRRRLQVLIEDRGPGVPEPDLETIFRPFTRSRGADAFVGYGLGLAITQRVIEAHGGEVRAENRAGGGLRIRMWLPLAGV